MSTLIEEGMMLLTDELPANAGGTVVYQRATDRTTLTAGFGRSEFTIENTQGMMTVQSDRDFIVAVSDLILGGQRATPQRGDRITLVDPLGRFRDVYEVLSPTGGDVYRRDPTGTVLRIHAKKL